MPLLSDLVNPYLLYIKIGLVALGVATVLFVGWHIKHTYNKVEAQTQQIKALTEEIDNAKRAVKLQADTQAALGRIDAQTYSNISTILNKPVNRVLIPSGLLPSVR